MRLLAASLLALSLAALLPAHAGTQPPNLVGRVSFVTGKVGWKPSASAWQDATVNDPLAAGMAVRTDDAAKAELRIGPMTIALAGGSRLDVTELDRKTAHLTLPQGRIEFVLRRLGDDQKVEVDIPRGGIWLLQPGRYDITAGTAQTPARVAVFAGRARFVGAHLDTAIKAGTAAQLSGSDPVVAATEEAGADSFADWCQSRDVDDSKLAALDYVSRAMTGYEELDSHGSWKNNSDNGSIWFPSNLPADWAPYRYGHWSRIAPWGWTWIDDQEWGFAPSHYGRWTRIDGHWGWVPGRRTADPGYAPAVVAFMGTPAVGISYAGGNGPAVAWFPLAPGEVYWPRYSDDIALIRQLNEGAVKDADSIASGAEGRVPAAIVTGHFANREFASVVPRSVFVGGKPVAASLLDLPSRRLAVAPLLMGGPQIPPAVPRAVASASPQPRPAGKTAAAAAKVAAATRHHPAPPIKTALAHGRKPLLHSVRFVPRSHAERHWRPIRQAVLRRHEHLPHRQILRRAFHLVPVRSARRLHGRVTAATPRRLAHPVRTASWMRHHRQHLAANLR